MRPAVTEVDQHGDVGPEQPASLPHALLELAIVHEVAKDDLHLEGAEAERERALELLADQVHHLADRASVRASGPDRRVGAERRPARAAEQLIGGPFELLPGKVVERHVHRAHGVDAQAPPAVVLRLPQHARVVRGELERVEPDHDRA